MPGNVPPVADERAGLLGFLAQQRYVLTLAAHGLTDEQARLAPTVSALSVGGLVKHVAHTERGWIDVMLQRPGDGGGGADYDANFRLGPDETLADVIAFYDAVAGDTDAVLAEVDLDLAVPVPRGVPWYPQDVDAWSARWVVLHIIEETARHAGHADIVREAVDGATAYPLMAAAEGWPATEWLQPWSPPTP
jgi:uncharacterized damage-inducible protein DinB